MTCITMKENYPYLKKIFDSERDANYKEFKIKVFEIDYIKSITILTVKFTILFEFFYMIQIFHNLS